MKLKRKHTGPIQLHEKRALFCELMGGEGEVGKKDCAMIAWQAFRIGVDISQHGQVCEADVEAFRIYALNKDEMDSYLSSIRPKTNPEMDGGIKNTH